MGQFKISVVLLVRGEFDLVHDAPRVAVADQFGLLESFEASTRASWNAITDGPVDEVAPTSVILSLQTREKQQVEL